MKTTETVVLIEILMGTFNGSGYVVDQNNSLQTQTYENWNLDIRDDAATYATVSLIEDMALCDSMINILHDDRGILGFNLNFHKLLSRAKSEYIMFCSQDDIWKPTKISKTLCFLISNEARNPGGSAVHPL